MDSESKKTVKRKQAIALSYAENDKAPKVIATGAGEIARRILELARENNVPIREDESLTSVLGKLDLGYEIPPETFRAVAEILAFLYKTDEEWRRRKEESNPKFAEVMDRREQNQLANPASTDPDESKK